MSKRKMSEKFAKSVRNSPQLYFWLRGFVIKSKYSEFKFRVLAFWTQTQILSLPSLLFHFFLPF